MKSEGKTTALALCFFLFVTVTGHFVKRYYDADGNSQVFVNSLHKSYIYTEKEASSFTDIKVAKNGQRYFIHPCSSDTCWNEAPKINPDISELLNSKPNSGSAVVSDVPTRTVVYPVSGSPYTFTLKAGQILDHWITFQQDRRVDISISSADYDYIIIYSETEKYHDGPNVKIPFHDPSKFYLQAGATDQVITMTLSQR